MPVFSVFYIHRVKARVIHCPRSPPTRGSNTGAVAKTLLPPLAPPAAFTTRQGIVLYIAIYFTTTNEILNVVLKAFAFDC